MATAKGRLMRNRLIQIISGLVAFSTVYATDVSGNISSNTTWSLANSPYVVTGNILVASGVTLRSITEHEVSRTPNDRRQAAPRPTY